MEQTTLLGNRYRLRQVLGQGGMATVHDGWDTRLDRPVAIKMLHTGLVAHPDMRQRFFAEARAAASLNHPAIVSVYDSGDHFGTPYIVMERLPGPTLADVLAAGPLSPPTVRTLLDDVLGALAAAHAAGILHRDIKPANILLTGSRDAVKVTDFGIAKTADNPDTMAGEILGTMAYLSPQRVAGSRASRADDIYAVGVVGYQALTGRPPFWHDNVGALARAIMDTPPPALTAVRPDVDPGLACIVERAMAYDPQQRFAHAEDMQAELRYGVSGPWATAIPARPPTKVLDASTAYAMSSAYVPPPRTRWNRRTTAIVGASAALVGLAAVLSVAAFDSPAPQPATPMPVTTSTPVSPPAPPSTPSTTSPPADAQVPPAPRDRGPGNGHGNGPGKAKGKKKG